MVSSIWKSPQLSFFENNLGASEGHCTKEWRKQNRVKDYLFIKDSHSQCCIGHRTACNDSWDSFSRLLSTIWLKTSCILICQMDVSKSAALSTLPAGGNRKRTGNLSLESFLGINWQREQGVPASHVRQLTTCCSINYVSAHATPEGGELLCGACWCGSAACRHLPMSQGWEVNSQEGGPVLHAVSCPGAQGTM